MSLTGRLTRAAVMGLLLAAAGVAICFVMLENKRLLEVRLRLESGLKETLALSGLRLGSPVFIRIFKESRELEVWLKPDGEQGYRLWRTYPIAGMSGKLGPKLKQGDAQAPEGFYEVSASAMNPDSSFHLSFNVGYPNTYDQGLERTGNFIMVHGDTASIGCFAMTDPVIEEIYLVADAALEEGQNAFAVHIFPFRMTEERMAQSADSPWHDFWTNLREGYLAFENSHTPPVVNVRNDRYAFR
ncbi:MAG: hypothetical protein RL693_386 [Verrucomicrobiota bacterium]|jgi:murein L,D-transpeptidase YafK